MKTDTVTLPSHWATALVNGDYSAMTQRETASINNAIRRLWQAGLEIVDVVDDSERFTWSYRLYDPLANVDGGTVCDYTALVKDE